MHASKFKPWFCLALLGILLTGTLRAATPRPGRITLGGGCTFWPLGVDYAWQDWGNDFATAGWAARWPTLQASLDSMAADGVHAVRWWVFTDFGSSPTWSGTGAGSTCTGLPAGWLADLKTVADYALSKNIKLYLTLSSFDMATTSHAFHHEDVISNATVRNSFINNAVIPIVQSLTGHQGVMAYDIVNEPEWMIQASDNGGANTALTQESLANVRAYVSAMATAIHANASQPCSVGSASLKWCGVDYDYWSGLGLDFFDVHLYDWMTTGGNTYSPTLRTVASLTNLADAGKPIICGEAMPQPGNHTSTQVGYTGSGSGTINNHQDMAQKLKDNGYAGYLVWAWNDTTFSCQPYIAPSFANFATANAGWVDPPQCATTPTFTLTPTFTRTRTRSPTATGTPSRTPTPTSSRTATTTATGTSTPVPSTGTPTASRTATPTRSGTPSPSASATVTAPMDTSTVTATRSGTPTRSTTPTRSETATLSPSPTGMPSLTAGNSFTPTVTKTVTFSQTVSPSASSTRSGTVTGTPSSTATVTATRTPAPGTATPTPTPSSSVTVSVSPSASSTASPTAALFSPTDSPSAASTASATPSPSATASPTGVASSTVTVTAVANTPTLSATALSSATATPAAPTALPGSGGPGYLQQLLPALNPQAGPDLALAAYFNGPVDGVRVSVYSPGYTLLAQVALNGPFAAAWQTLKVPMPKLPHGLLFVQAIAINGSHSAGLAKNTRVYWVAP